MGEYSSPKATSSTVQPSYGGGNVSSGVGDGLSSVKDLDSENIHDLKVGQSKSVSGNPRQNIKPRASKSVSSKGNDFDMC